MKNQNTPFTRIVSGLLSGENYLNNLSGEEWRLLLDLFTNDCIKASGDGVERLRVNVPNMSIGFREMDEKNYIEISKLKTDVEGYSLHLNSKIFDPHSCAALPLELSGELFSRIPTISGWEIIKLMMIGATPQQRIDIMEKNSTSSQKELREYKNLVQKFQNQLADSNIL